MLKVDAGGGDQLAVAVLAQYRMTTTEQLHLLIAPEVRHRLWPRHRHAVSVTATSAI